MSSESDYYISRKPRLLREFNSYARHAHPALIRYFGAENVSFLVAEAREIYELLILQLPYIGGKQPFTQFVTSTGIMLALYRVAKAHGKTLEETGQLIYEVGKEVLHAYPVFLARFLSGVNFSRRYLDRLQNAADESHQRQYPGDYVYNFIEGDGKTFDYGVDYLECASCKFLAQQGAAEIAPYLCPVDILYSQALGWGLMRTMTLAEGAEKCDFRFKKGGQTRVAVPLALQRLVAID